MTSKRIFFVMIGVMFVSVAASGFAIYFGNNLLVKQSRQLTDLKAENSLVQEKQTISASVKKDIAKYSDLEAVAKAIVPQDKDQARTIREINKIAGDNGIKLKTISFNASNLGSAPAKPTGGTTPTAPTSTITQVKPTEGITGVYTLEIIVSSLDDSPVPYPKLLDFLEDLEKNRRTAHVSKMTLVPNENSTGVNFTLTLNSYVKP
jgi:hypothetical protein